MDYDSIDNDVCINVRFLFGNSNKNNNNDDRGNNCCLCIKIGNDRRSNIENEIDSEIGSAAR